MARQHKIVPQILVSGETEAAGKLASRLEALGYRVFASPSPAERSEKKSDPEQPDLVLAAQPESGAFFQEFSAPTIHILPENIAVPDSENPFEFLREPLDDRTLDLAVKGALYLSRLEAKQRADEDSRRESDEKFRIVSEQSLMAVTIANEEGFLYVNQAFADLVETPISEILTWDRAKIRSLIHPDDRDIALQRGMAKLAGRLDISSRYTYRWVTPSGRTRWLDQYSKAVTYHGRRAVLIIMADITARIESEAAVRESEEKYRSLFENAPLGIGVTDEKGNIVAYNPAMLLPGGYSPEEAARITHITDFYYDIEERNHLLAILRKQGYVDGVEVRFKRKDGTPYETHMSVRPVRIGGKPHLLAIVLDITERKQVENALKESELRMREAQAVARLGSYSRDLRTGVALLSDQNYRIFGYEPGEIEFDDHFLAAHIHPDDKEKFFQVRDRAKETDGLTAVEYRVIDRNGELRYFYSTAMVEKDSAGVPIRMFGITQDITERKTAEIEKARLEENLRQARKMEAIGTLAGGLAHDFNNLLMGIQGNVSLMLLDVPPGHRHYDKLTGIEKFVESGSGLTRQLLGFARGGKYEVRPTDVNELIRQGLKMFGRTRKEIVIHTSLTEVVSAIEADRGQIGQVLLNLYLNAWQAMPEGGEMYVGTRDVTIGESDPRAVETAPGRYVLISITDTGVGMDERTRTRIFEPFFTTKEMGRGAGLGLASAYGIVQNHGGRITVYSEPGSGTTFNVYLPASDKRPVPEPETARAPCGGRETVLLVDDEELIADVGRQMLESLGYDALVAVNGLDAISVYQSRQADVALVVLDMVMPDMGGGETFDRLKAINPEVKVLLSSGYSLNGQAVKIMDRGCRGFIQKPYNLNELSRRIREILDRP